MTGAAPLILAHVAGIPFEEAVLSLAPVLALGGWAYLRAWVGRGGAAARPNALGECDE